MNDQNVASIHTKMKVIIVAKEIECWQLHYSIMVCRFERASAMIIQDIFTTSSKSTSIARDLFHCLAGHVTTTLYTAKVDTKKNSSCYNTLRFSLLPIYRVIRKSCRYNTCASQYHRHNLDRHLVH